MRKPLGASLLVLTLFCSVRAGNIPSVPFVSPRPLAAGGEIHTGATESTPELDGLTGVALGLLHSVLTLL